MIKYIKILVVVLFVFITGYKIGAQTQVTVNSTMLDYLNDSITVTGTRSGAASIVCTFGNLTCTLNGAASRTITPDKAARIKNFYPDKIALARAVVEAYQSDPVQ